MRMIPQSFNGFTFQQVNRVSSCWTIDYDWSIQGIATNAIARSQNFPLYAAKTYAGSVKVIRVTLSDVDADRDSLVIAMDVLGDSQHQLIANDQFGRAWYINAVCSGLNEEGVDGNTANFGAVFEVDDPIWKKVIESTETILVDETGSGTLTPIGNQPALPIIEMTPTGVGDSGFKYQRFIAIVNESPNALVNYPLNIAGTVLNTSAIVADDSNKCLINQVGGINNSVTTIPYDNVTGTIPDSGLVYVDTEQIQYTGKTGTTSGNLTGCTRGVNGTSAATHADNAVMRVSKMAANGNDVRVYVDGVEVKRWFYDFNTANTKIWVNWNQPANTDMTLGADIAASGAITTIDIENIPANAALISTIPSSGNVLIGSEIFVYTGVNVGGLQLTGITRASKGTSEAAHTSGDAVKFVTHDLYLYYGNPNIDTYVVDDTYKPIIKLTSTNTSHIYEEFGTGTALRTGEWAKLGTGRNVFYSGTQFTSADPWTAAGLVNQRAGTWGAPTIPYGYSIYNPCGITHVTATGYKKKNTGSPTWWILETEKSSDGLTYANVWTEAAPSSFDAWEALSSHSSVSLSGTYSYVRVVNNTVWNSADNLQVWFYHEFTDVTLTIDSTKDPTISVGAEVTGVPLTTVITNAATGESLSIRVQLDDGFSLTIDTEQKTIVSSDGVNQINALYDMPIRAEWLKLLPSQANAISITDPNQVTFVFTWADRTL